MWKISGLKTKAKLNLKGKYWFAFLATLIFLSLTGGAVGTGSSARHQMDTQYAQRIRDFMQAYPGVFALIVIIIIILSIAVLVAAICYSVFVVLPIYVGQKSYFLKNREQKPEMGILLSAYNHHHKNVAKVMFRKYLSILLWSLLLIIPGIIKAFQYFAVEYLLAEDPSLNFQEATAKSKELTNGHKMHILGLYLSFIGWYILCALTMGLGILFLTPYLEATSAELYISLKEKTVVNS